MADFLPGTNSELLILRARMENILDQMRLDRSALVGNLSKEAQDIVSIDASISRIQRALERCGDDEG